MTVVLHICKENHCHLRNVTHIQEIRTNLLDVFASYTIIFWRKP